MDEEVTFEINNHQRLLNLEDEQIVMLVHDGDSEALDYLIHKK